MCIWTRFSALFYVNQVSNLTIWIVVGHWRWTTELTLFPTGDLVLTCQMRFQPFEDTMRRVPQAKPTGLFKCPIQQTTKREKRAVPFIITSAVREVERRGITEVSQGGGEEGYHWGESGMWRGGASHKFFSYIIVSLKITLFITFIFKYQICVIAVAFSRIDAKVFV